MSLTGGEILNADQLSRIVLTDLYENQRLMGSTKTNSRFEPQVPASKSSIRLLRMAWSFPWPTSLVLIGSSNSLGQALLPVVCRLLARVGMASCTGRVTLPPLKNDLSSTLCQLQQKLMVASWGSQEYSEKSFPECRWRSGQFLDDGSVVLS